MLKSPFTNKTMSAVMDLDYDLSCALHTPGLLRRKFDLLAAHGLETIYIVAPPDGKTNYSSAAFETPPGDDANFIRASRANFGGLDPLATAITFAKQAGLRVMVEFKPYEGGGNVTIPHGAIIPQAGHNALPTLGGLSVGVEPFIFEHPECLLARRPEQEVTGAIDTIEIAYVDEGKMAPEVRLYTSTDNGCYLPYPGRLDVSIRKEHRRIVDGNGLPLGDEPVMCQVLNISHLALDVPYFALAVANDPAIPAWARAWANGEAVPITVSTQCRQTFDHRPLPFEQNGFDFEVSGSALAEEGVRPMPLWGIARGKLRHLRGCLCEAYPQVRDYWLKRIRHFINLGADGVELRLQNHCSGVSDFAAYGYNEPLLAAWRNRYGDEVIDPLKLMALRGEFFTLFAREAAALLHRHHCTLSIQLHAYMVHPSLSTARQEFGFWANAKILPDYRQLIALADEVVIKNYNFGRYLPQQADEIKTLAAESGKALLVHCYLQQGHDWCKEFVDAVNADERVTGLLLYEVVWNAREKDGLVKVAGDQVEWTFGPLWTQK